eukprot:SAG11_NODE_10547_length_822_cov_7.892116_1_plen_82_part_00
MEVIINSDKMLCREHDKGMEKNLDLFLTKHSTVHQYCTSKFRYDKNLDPFFTIRSAVKSTVQVNLYVTLDSKPKLENAPPF